MMVRSHATGDMNDATLRTWLDGTNHLTACEALYRTASIMEHTEIDSAVVSMKFFALIRAGECFVAALGDDIRGGMKITWNAYLRLTASVLEAHDRLLLEAQTVCCNHIVAAELQAAISPGACVKRSNSSEHHRESSSPLRKSRSHT